MLVLSRKIGESIDVGGSRITVLEVRPGGRVKLGIDANPNVQILRGELLEEPADMPTDLVEA